METINVTKETKDEFEKERFNQRFKENRIVSQDRFMLTLLKCWKNSQNEI